jgi:hypothetical protein
MLCLTAQLTIPEDHLGPGAPRVDVRNPAPAACDTTDGEDVTMAIVPRPSVTSVEPDLFCSEQAPQTLTLQGADFIVIRDAAGDAYPTVTIGTETLMASDAGGCGSVAGTLLDAESCTSLTVEVPAGTALTGEQDVFVTNPDPAGCESEEPVSVFIAGAPDITGFEPTAVCSTAQPASMRALGSGFLRVDDGAGGFIEPSVTLDGAPLAVTFDPADCTDFTSSVASGQLCTAFSFAVPGGGFADGVHTVVITNPEPADCSDSEDFGVAPAPVVTDVQPFKVCSEGDVFTVTGSGFVPGSEVLVSGVAVPTTFVSAAEVRGTIAPGAFADGLYDVAVRNGAGCESNTLAGALRVVDAPIVFFVDPPNVYNGIDMRVTVWVSGVSAGDMGLDPPEVGVRPTGSADPLTMLSNPVYDGDNKIQATVLAGQLAAGDYDVVVIDTPCEGELIDGLHVTENLTVHVESIDPAFGVEDERIGVTIRSLDPPPAGFEAFEPTPRLYVNPVGGGVATELQAVSFLAADQLTAVVPDNVLAPGVHQLVVVNPDGDVGLLDNAYTVLDAADPPPEITDLVPGLVDDKPAQAVDVLGLHFPTDTAAVSVTARCRDPRDPAAPDVMVTAAVPATSATLIDTSWDMTGLAGYVCVVRVTNLANGTYADFSAISVTNPASNLNPFVLSNDMIEPRRAGGGAAIRMNAQSRFLFAIGGDTGGATPTRHASVESAPIDPFGEPGSWSPQRNALPSGRAFFAADVVGRHVYVAGGRTGSATADVSDEVLRAYLLDPAEAPVIDDLDLVRGEGTGLDGGIWIYRVAAVMGPTDPNNPDGEGLPSEPLVVQLPALPEKLHLTLYWDGIPGAVAYRIYRTPAPGDISGEELLLAEIAHNGAAAKQELTDDGALAPVAPGPMPLGSLGTWHQVGTLTVAREGAALVVAPDPGNADRHYLYVIGGRTAAGVVTGAYEWATITAAAPNDQTIGALAVGLSALPGARWKLGAVWADATRSTAIPAGEAWVYALPGRGGVTSEMTVGDVTAFRVDAVGDGLGDDDGSLDSLTPVASVMTGFAGYGYVAGNDFIHLLGAQTGAPHNGGMKSEIIGAPTLDPWEAGTVLTTQRFLHATARESAFVFLLGGQTGAEAATRTTERTNF